MTDGPKLTPNNFLSQSCIRPLRRRLSLRTPNIETDDLCSRLAERKRVRVKTKKPKDTMGILQEICNTLFSIDRSCSKKRKLSTHTQTQIYYTYRLLTRRVRRIPQDPKRHHRWVGWGATIDTGLGLCTGTTVAECACVLGNPETTRLCSYLGPQQQHPHSPYGSGGDFSSFFGLSSGVTGIIAGIAPGCSATRLGY